MIRRLLIVVLVFLIAVVIAADRVGEVVASHVLAGKLQTDEHLAHRPDASIGGLPFLNQAINGKYDDVSVTAHDVVVTGGLTVSTLVAHLHGVHVPLAKALHNSVKTVPVDSVDGSATVTFADADSYLAKDHLRISPGGTPGTLNVTGLQGFGGRTRVKVARPTVAGNVITLAVRRLVVGGNGVARQPLVSIKLPLQSLPFRIALRTVTVTATGLVATGGARHVVLGS